MKNTHVKTPVNKPVSNAGRPGGSEELRQATREAHEVLRDLREERKRLAEDRRAAADMKVQSEELLQEMTAFLQVMRDSYREVIEQVVKREITRLQREFKAATDGARASIYAKFEGLLDLILGTPTGPGNPFPFEESVARWGGGLSDTERTKLLVLALQRFSDAGNLDELMATVAETVEVIEKVDLKVPMWKRKDEEWASAMIAFRSGLGQAAIRREMGDWP